MPAIAPIDSEITIERQNDALLIELGHPDEASIRKRHGYIRKLLHQPA